MLGIQKSNTTPLFLTTIIATLITIAAFLLLPKFQKYKAEIVSSQIHPAEIHVFDDLDGDNISERIKLFLDFNGTAALIVEKNDKILYQHNFSGKFTNTNYYFINDYNNDLLKEIYLFTIRNDSLFLHIIEGVTEKVIAENIFLSTFLFHSSHPDIYITNCEMQDFDGDKSLDLFININCSFTYKNRKNITYDIAKNKIKMNKATGVALSGDVQLFDINTDGVFEIFGGFGSFGNSPSNYFLSDTFMWLITPNINSKMLFPPQNKGFSPGNVTTKPIKQNNENKIVYFYCYYGSNNDSSYIAIVTQNGKEQKKLNFKYDIFLRGAYFNTIPEKNPNKIILFCRNGTVKTFDSQLNQTREYQSFPFFGFIRSFDIDDDAIQELIFMDKNLNIILSRNNLLHPVYLPIKVTTTPQISVENTKQGKKLLNIQAGETLYKIDYFKNPFYPVRFLLFFFIWIATFVIFHFIGKVYKNIATRRYESEKKLATLQITAIENQLNPHFNLNILNSIGALYETHEKDKAQYYMGKYSKLLRNSLMQAGKIAVTIEEELEFTQNYIELEKLRMNGSFEYSISGEDDYLNLEIPKMLIHTFCENSVKHGLRHLSKIGKLDIHFLKENQLIKIYITDNGIGRTKAKQYSLMSTGKGIEIIKQTLNLYFQLNGIRISYNISDIYDEQQNVAGTKVEITIPV